MGNSASKRGKSTKGDLLASNGHGTQPQTINGRPAAVTQNELTKFRVRALYDYQASSPEELTFKKHDVMIVYKMDEEWWSARHLETGCDGYIPRNFVVKDDRSPESHEAWFANVMRMEADSMLMSVGLPLGTYLLRPSTNAGCYALSVRCQAPNSTDCTVRHYKIIEIRGNFYIDNHVKSPFFKTMHDLLQHYSEQQSGLCCLLNQPCPREYVPPVDFRAFEVDRKGLQLMRRLGGGYYGEVWLAKWNRVLDVAVKQPKMNSNMEKIIIEARIMHRLNHPRIVRLLGVCTSENPEIEPIYIITEYMRKGSLRDFLRGPEGQLLSHEHLFENLAQIADGMHYMEEKSVVHRDLRADNILVHENRSVKIADFGLALPESNHEVQQGHIPMKWTAPEAATSHLYTSKSDVWSFGILIYEVITYGCSPYRDMNPKDSLEWVKQGNRMANPSLPPVNKPCPEWVYNIMLKCWDSDPINRPGFTALQDLFMNFKAHTESQYL